MDREAQTQKRNPGQPFAEYLIGKVSFVAYVLTECVSDPTWKLREAGEHFSDSSVDLVSALAYGKGWGPNYNSFCLHPREHPAKELHL